MLQLYELSVLKTVEGEVAKAASGPEVQDEFDGDAKRLQAPVGRALAFVPRAHHSYFDDNDQALPLVSCAWLERHREGYLALCSKTASCQQEALHKEAAKAFCLDNFSSD